MGSNPGRAIPKALKMVPVATLLGAQHYKASTGFSSNKHRTTITNKKSEKKLSPIIINVCIHRRTVWKTGNYAKYVILLKYRDYYYYYLRHVVSLSKDTFTPRKELVIPRKRGHRTDMTEKLLTEALSINTNKLACIFRKMVL